MIKTIRHVTIAKIKKIEDINFSSFKSELRGLGVTIEGVGIIDSKLTTIGVWLANRDKETNEILERTPTSDFQRGVVYYLKDNVVVGVILWNASDQMNKAREIVNDKKITKENI